MGIGEAGHDTKTNIVTQSFKIADSSHYRR